MNGDFRRAVSVSIHTDSDPEIELERYEELIKVTITAKMKGLDNLNDQFLEAVMQVCKSSIQPQTVVLGLKERYPEQAVIINQLNRELSRGSIHRKNKLQIVPVGKEQQVLCIRIVAIRDNAKAKASG